MPRTVAANVTELYNTGHVIHVTAKITDDPTRAPGGTFIPGGGIVVPCIYKLYGNENGKPYVRGKLANATFATSDMQ